MTQLRDKVVWITGASSGIGEALALQASREGAKLILSARREAELQRVRQACADPARVAVLPLDLTAFDAVAATRPKPSSARWMFWSTTPGSRSGAWCSKRPWTSIAASSNSISLPVSH